MQSTVGQIIIKSQLLQALCSNKSDKSSRIKRAVTIGMERDYDRERERQPKGVTLGGTGGAVPVRNEKGKRRLKNGL